MGHSYPAFVVWGCWALSFRRTATPICASIMQAFGAEKLCVDKLFAYKPADPPETRRLKNAFSAPGLNASISTTLCNLCVQISQLFSVVNGVL